MKPTATEMAAYVEDGKTNRDIATIAGVSSSTIHTWCKQYGIERDTVCPHCQRTLKRLDHHVCIENPELDTKIRNWLHAHAEDGVIMSKGEYMKLSIGTGLPACSRLEITVGGWKAVAERYGLQPRPRTRIKKNFVCSHCDSPLSEKKFIRHQKICACNPDVAERLTVFLAEIAADGWPSQETYRMHNLHRKADMPTAYQLVRIHGGWNNAGEYFGYPAKGGHGLGRDELIEEIYKWWSTAEGKRYAVDWDKYAKGKLPNSSYIREIHGLIWTELEDEFHKRNRRPLRDEMEEGWNYRPYRKISTWMKDEATRLTAHIADEAEHAREYMRLLGLPPELLGESGD